MGDAGVELLDAGAVVPDAGLSGVDAGFLAACQSPPSASLSWAALFVPLGFVALGFLAVAAAIIGWERNKTDWDGRSLLAYTTGLLSVCGLVGVLWTLRTHVEELMCTRFRCLTMEAFVGVVAAEMVRSLSVVWFCYQVLKSAERLLVPMFALASGLRNDPGLLRVFLGMKDVPQIGSSTEEAGANVAKPLPPELLAALEKAVESKGDQAQAEKAKGEAARKAFEVEWLRRRVLGMALFFAALAVEVIAWWGTCETLNRSLETTPGTENTRGIIAVSVVVTIVSVGLAWMASQALMAAGRMIVRHDQILDAQRGDPALLRALIGVEDPVDGMQGLVKSVQSVVDTIQKVRKG